MISEGSRFPRLKWVSLWGLAKFGENGRGELEAGIVAAALENASSGKSGRRFVEFGRVRSTEPGTTKPFLAACMNLLSELGLVIGR